MVRRIVTGVAAVGAALMVPAAAVAAGPLARVKVGPRAIGTESAVTISFRQPLSTGNQGDERAWETIYLSRPSGSSCLGDRGFVLPAVDAGQMVRYRLAPRQLRSRWCSGTYDGRVLYQVEPACQNPGPIRSLEACPMFIMAPRTLATFRFHVAAR